MIRPYKYRAFGLRIRSDFELPELVPHDFDEADLKIAQVETGISFPAPDEPGEFRFGDEECFMLYPQVGAFRLIKHDRIEVELVPGVHPGLIAFPLLGPLFGLLLRARHCLVLHGSALEVNGEGIAFLGDKGAGKSTTASTFVRAGHRLLTDDVLAIAGAEQGQPTILPAFPQVKLSESAIGALQMKEVRHRAPVPIVQEKQRMELVSGFSGLPVSPSRFFLLRRGPDIGLQYLDPKVRLKALLRFSYVSRFGPRAMTRLSAAEHVRQCAALAENISIAILTVPDDLSRLDEIVELVTRNDDAQADAA